MEKIPTGSYVFRNCRAEEREATKHAENRQKTLEVLLAKIQVQLEKNKGKMSILNQFNWVVFFYFTVNKQP